VAVSEPEDDPIDRVVERIMLGQDPDVEALIADAPDMAAETRDRLRKLAGTFGPLRIDATAGLSRDEEPQLTELGPYKVLSRMGEGGMGMVYLAEHRFLERRVALKVIRPELAFSKVTRQRFQREATRIAKLRHENIVSVYDAGEHEGVAYLAMEVVEGPGLDELLESARKSGTLMDVTEAVRHARDIARALQCAHAAGIVHRDVKPSNVRITPDGRALLLDFGLSLAEEPASMSSLGQFRGTPQYASPEQVELSSADIDARTDVYSLGLTLYECLTGQVPFEGGTLIQLFHQILARDLPEPRRRNARVDPVLNDIVMRAIAKRREDRFDGAGEMAEALDAWLQDAKAPASTASRAPGGIRKPLIAAVVLGLLVAAWFVFHGGGGGLAAARPGALSDARSIPRSTTALLGDADRAFDQRLDHWSPAVGSGTFGADEDGPGAIGVCVDGISSVSHALPGGSGCVRGRFEPIASAPGARTQGAGAGIEFSNGRAVALLLVATADGYDLRVCELRREGTTRWTRGPDLESRTVSSTAGRPLDFRLSWNDTDARFDWSDAGTWTDSASFPVPSELRGGARPSGFLLVVEKGSARFEGLVLEES
jgi:tRNA A-37 threonylcarbamoyl transferase component Bud32